MSTVGVAGFTLGGGISYLTRKHGLGVDNLAGADVVLAVIQTQAAKARARKLATAAEELDRLVRTAGTRFHPTAYAVAAAPRRSPPSAAWGPTCAP